MKRFTAADHSKTHLRRVLYVTALNPALKFGSLEEQIFILARTVKEQGSLFLPLFQKPLGAGGRAAYEAEGLQAEWLDMAHFKLASLQNLAHLIDRHRIELIHWNFYGPLNRYFLALAVLRPRVSHYLTDHNSRDLDPTRIDPVQQDGRIKRRVKRNLLSRYDKVLCVSEFVRQNLIREGIWPNLSCCIHFINTHRFRPDLDVRCRVRNALDSKARFVVLVVSNLIRAKGVDVVLTALSKLPKEMVLWVVGGGDDFHRLNQLSCGLAVEDRVRFFGYRSDVSRYMQAADCLVVPSVWGEAAGLVILEGLASGLPVVASNVGGIPEFVEDGTTGFLFHPRDDNRLAEIIRSLEKDPACRQNVGRRARAAAVERFSVEARLGKYLELYRHPDSGE